jgi:hypothetical protein
VLLRIRGDACGKTNANDHAQVFAPFSSGRFSWRARCHLAETFDRRSAADANGPAAASRKT